MKKLIQNVIALIVGLYTMPAPINNTTTKEQGSENNYIKHTRSVVYSDSPEYLDKNDFINYMLNTKGIICL